MAVVTQRDYLEARKRDVDKMNWSISSKQLCGMNVSVVELSAMYNEYITNNHKQDIQ